MKSGFLAALLAIPLILTGCSDQPGSPAADKKAEPLQVETIRPVMETSAPREFPGSVSASRLLPMASRLPAYIRSVPHQEGDLVKRGDVVAVLDDSDVRSIREQAYADVKAASIRLRDAETDVQKFEGLYRDEAASEIELRKVKLLRDQTAETLRAARARLTQANERLGDAVIRAPEPARVLSIQLQPGTLAVPGLPIVTLESLDGQVFEIHLPAELCETGRPCGCDAGRPDRSHQRDRHAGRTFRGSCDPHWGGEDRAPKGGSDSHRDLRPRRDRRERV